MKTWRRRSAGPRIEAMMVQATQRARKLSPERRAALIAALDRLSGAA